MKAVLIDGYVDEPAVLGVPPYISPYVRYVYGALISSGVETLYTTIDRLREREDWRFDADIVIVYGGTTVPGHYLSGTPLTLTELNRILSENSHAVRVVSGPITRSYTIRGGTVAVRPRIDADHVVLKDVWVFLEDLLKGKESPRTVGDYKDVDRLALAGAELVAHHPMFPNVICEVEVSKGCERDSFCSFCTEPLLHGRLKSRKVEGIVEEVRRLYEFGCRAFRLGRTANILAYMSDFNSWKPVPGAVKDLYSGIRDVAPELEVLHTDNANPSYLVRYLKESVRIIETIVEYNTPGDVLSFGAESFDIRVLKANNVESTPEEILKAVEVVNEIGGERVEGVPKLLPGINLLYGLPGEDEKTYRVNYEFLKRILEMGLLLRRINIRQVMVHPGTRLFRHYSKTGFRLNKGIFKYWKDRVRREIDHPMLKRVFPKGAVLRNVIPEKRKGKINFGRPLGTYPILVGTPSPFTEKSDFVVVDHGMRSVTALRHPLDVNSLGFEELVSIEGIGKKRAEEIILKRPFKDFDDMASRLSPETWEHLKEILKKW